MWRITWVQSVLLVLSLSHNCDGSLPPIFNDTFKVVVIAESASLGTVIGNITVTDVDGDTLTLTLKDANTRQYVRLNITENIGGRISADVILNKELDYENKPTIILQFQAVDNAYASIATIQILVQDVNDNPPLFVHQPYLAHIPENAVNGTLVFNATVSDMDRTGLGGIVSVSLLTHTELFHVTNEGMVSLIGDLDYEQVPFYNVRLIAEDHGKPKLSSTAELFVTVTDVQDTPPYFTNLPYIPEIWENYTVGSTVFRVSAMDGDRGNSENISFSLSNSTCPGFFSIELDGRIKLLKTADRDNGAVSDNSGICVLTVKARETKGSTLQPGPLFEASRAVTITVKDLNDNSPTFRSTNLSATIRENMPAGVPVTFNTPLQVSDKDQENNAKITLSLSNYAEYFTLTPSKVQGSSVIQVKVTNSSLLDYETHQTLQLKIVASDGSSSSTATATLHIENENDNSPQFSETSYQGSVQEGSSVGTSVLTITAVGHDLQPLSLINYKLFGAYGIFAIDAHTGTIRVSDSKDLDRERQDTYRLTVEAVDKGGRRDSTVVTIKLTDINDNAPVFSRVEYIANLVEGNTHFEREVKVEATDYDQAGTDNSFIRFTLSTNQPLYTNFSINSTTGILTPRGPIDYESLSASTIVLSVIASDEGTPSLMTTVNVTIHVQDTNDNWPTFTATSYSGIVAESAQTGTPVLQVNASDADGTAENSAILYILAGSGCDKFQIDGTNGSITVVGRLDREQVAHYNLTVTAMDRGTPLRENTTSVFVFVANVNDEIPSFTQSNIIQKVNETNATHTLLYTMAAVDQDENANLSYSVLWNESTAIDENFVTVPNNRIQNIMDVNSVSGKIRLYRTLDREEVEMIILKLHVVDLMAVANKPQTATATLTLSVLDIDDNPPEFNSSFYTATIVENSVPGIPIDVTGTLITVSDKDKDRNSIFALSLENHADVFEVVPDTVRSSSTVLIRVKNSTQLDYETIHNMTLTLLAKETQTSASLWSRVQIDLHILDANDNDPMFVQHSYGREIPEDSPNGSFVIQLNATDMDSSKYDLKGYSIQGSQSTFAIDAHTGMIRVSDSKDLDRERQDTYRLTVEAVDKGGRRDSTVVTIKLTDVNDNAPVFSRVEYTAYLVEGNTHFEREVKVEATDRDQAGTNNSDIWYSLTAIETLHSRFIIDPTTGLLTPKGPIDCKSLTSSTIFLEAIASDAGAPPQKSFANVTINVQCKRHNSCLNNGPCQNGGTCTVGKDNTSTCHCPPGFTGAVCEKTDSVWNVSTLVDQLSSGLEGGTFQEVIPFYGDSVIVCEESLGKATTILLVIDGSVTAQMYIDKAPQPVVIRFMQQNHNALFQQDLDLLWQDRGCTLRDPILHCEVESSSGCLFRWCSKCEEGFYKLGIACEVCPRVHAGCSHVTCTSANQDLRCTSCYPEFFLNGDNCTECTSIPFDCADYTCTRSGEYTCSRCKNGSLLIDGHCLSCPSQGSIPDCVDVGRDGCFKHWCNKCAPGFFIRGDACDVCPTDDPGCQKTVCNSTSDSLCVQCFHGYDLIGGKCNRIKKNQLPNSSCSDSPSADCPSLEISHGICSDLSSACHLCPRYCDVCNYCGTP